MSMYKDISLTERYKLQFRGDAFNIFNHANSFVDGGSALYDIFTTPIPAVHAFKAGNRRVQVSARFIF